VIVEETFRAAAAQVFGLRVQSISWTDWSASIRINIGFVVGGSDYVTVASLVNFANALCVPPGALRITDSDGYMEDWLELAIDFEEPPTPVEGVP
jgi:hypothetical protein